MKSANFHCSDCDTVVAESAKFCPACGAAFDESLCPSCGTKTSEGASLCPACGAYEETYGTHKESTESSTAGAGVLEPTEFMVYEGSARARTAASIVEIFGWLLVVISVIAGIALMIHTEGRYDDHPYVAQGAIGLVLGSVNGLFIVMASTYVQARLAFDSHVGGLADREPAKT
jgi:RNA polymerase subunit RPABC4/transcription elongation factor Spt4